LNLGYSGATGHLGCVKVRSKFLPCKQHKIESASNGAFALNTRVSSERGVCVTMRKPHAPPWPLPADSMGQAGSAAGGRCRLCAVRLLNEAIPAFKTNIPSDCLILGWNTTQLGQLHNAFTAKTTAAVQPRSPSVAAPCACTASPPQSGPAQTGTCSSSSSSSGSRSFSSSQPQ
jgi:hypothetical protein